MLLDLIKKKKKKAKILSFHLPLTLPSITHQLIFKGKPQAAAEKLCETNNGVEKAIQKEAEGAMHYTKCPQGLEG